MGVPTTPSIGNEDRVFVVSLHTVSRDFPGALEWFDWACPRLANSDDLRFVQDRWRGGEARLTAISAARTPEERRQVTDWWVTPGDDIKVVYLAARWDWRIGVWVRVDAEWSWRKNPARAARARAKRAALARAHACSDRVGERAATGPTSLARARLDTLLDPEPERGRAVEAGLVAMLHI